MLQRYNFSEEDFRGERFKDFPHPLKGNNDLLSLTQPQAIKAVHAAYFEAGADIVETNTFSGTTIGMADYHLEDLVYELNYESAKLAREVADEFTAKNPDQPRFVADKSLILETAKELLYQERLKDSVRLLGISLNNLNTNQKKNIVVQLKFEF